MKLSVVIPVYNEIENIETLLSKVKAAKISIDKEVIIVNDGSTDGTEKVILKWIEDNKDIAISFFSQSNQGKGSAVRKGIQNSTGDIVIIQDADLEYEPNEYERCIIPILKKEYYVVYGSRVRGHPKKVSSLCFYLGGHLVTFVTNVLFFSSLTDEATCYKVYHGELIRTLLFNGDKFDWEPEITAKLLRLGFKIGEVPISYYPRKITEGKKIKWTDGVDALWTLLKWRFFSIKDLKLKVKSFNLMYGTKKNFF